MKKIKIGFIIAAAALMLFVSCKGLLGPDGVTPQVFSVTFQRGVFPDSSFTEAYDNTIVSDDPTDNKGTSASLYVGYYSNPGWEVERVPMKFDIDGYLPSGAVVTKAMLVLYVYDVRDIASIDITCYRITTDWAEGTSTWQTPWVSNGGDFADAVSNTIIVTTSDINTYVTLELDKDEVQSWISTPASNYGFMIKSSSEDTGEPCLRSSDYSTLVQRPKLIVYYTIGE